MIESSVTIGEYFYDGDGKRVKKIAGSEETVFVYDAGGKLIGEYSTVVQTGSNAKTVYTTNDHLGSPRINTDGTGTVISRHDYHPFGEEIARTGYGSDTIRKQFTGYERDGETELDFAQARYFASGYGRFSTPDAPFFDQHAEVPQSWNLYVYVRNNPTAFVDPTGTKGKITVKIDEKNKTGVITIEASFAVYVKAGKYSAADFQKEVAKFEGQVRDSFNPLNKFTKDGVKYTVQALITVTPATSESDAKSKGVDNIVGLVNAPSFTEYHDPQNPTQVAGKAYQVQGESFDRIVIATQDPDPNLGGHETGHSLGGGGHLEDGHPQSVIIPGIMSGRGPSAKRMTSQDFDHILSRPIQDHKSGVPGVLPFTRAYPAETTKTYRSPAIYNRNVVP